MPFQNKKRQQIEWYNEYIRNLKTNNKIITMATVSESVVSMAAQWEGKDDQSQCRSGSGGLQWFIRVQ